MHNFSFVGFVHSKLYLFAEYILSILPTKRNDFRPVLLFLQRLRDALQQNILYDITDFPIK